MDEPGGKRSLVRNIKAQLNALKLAGLFKIICCALIFLTNPQIGAAALIRLAALNRSFTVSQMLFPGTGQTRLKMTKV